MNHVVLRLSDIVRHLGSVTTPRAGTIDLLSSTQSCGCVITTSKYAGIFDLALCDIHYYLTTSEGRLSHDRKKNDDKGGGYQVLATEIRRGILASDFPRVGNLVDDHLIRDRRQVRIELHWPA